VKENSYKQNKRIFIYIYHYQHLDNAFEVVIYTESLSTLVLW